MQKTSAKDFTVAIVGGGMCGLACAIGLARAGIYAKIFEATAKFDEVGAGVALGPNALRALKGLGLLEKILEIIDVADSTQEGFRFVGGTGAHEHIYDVPNVEIETETESEKRGFGIYRPTFLAALMPLIDPGTVSFNKRLVSTTILPSGQHRLCFTDDTTYDVDLVIGADGIKSTVRTAVMDTGAVNDKIMFVNTYVYRGMVPVSALKAAGVKIEVKRPYLWTGLGKHMATYPIKGQTILNVGAMCRTQEIGTPISPEAPYPWVQSVDQQELLEAFQDWGSDAITILNHITQPSRWALHTLYPPLETYMKDRIALVGDAAHAMLPYLGAGVGQGFEDVYVLCRLLAHPKAEKNTLNALLALYDNLRRPRANMVLEQSLRAGDIPQSFGPGRYDAEEVRRKLVERYNSEWHQYLLNHDLEGEVSKALEEF